MVGSSLDSILPSGRVDSDECRVPGGVGGRPFVSAEIAGGAGRFFGSTETASCTTGVMVPFVAVCESDP
jgi:hypothetical protein